MTVEGRAKPATLGRRLYLNMPSAYDRRCRQIGLSMTHTGGSSTASRAEETTMQACQHMCEVLIEAGIDHVFGIPGGGTGPLFNAIHDHRDKIRFILTR